MLSTAEAFSNAFAEKLAGVRSSTALAAPQSSTPPITSSFDHFEIIDPSTIWRLVSNAAGKSCELDPVPSWVIQKFADEPSPFVAALFNASMSSGSFSTSQKTASITSILKKATLVPDDLSNYRPTSNLTFLSKLFERAAWEQIVCYTLTDFNYFQRCRLHTANIGQPKQLQSRSCPTFTRRLMQSPSLFSAFLTTTPRSTWSTIAFYSIASRTNTVSGDGSFSEIESYTSRDAVNSCGTTGSPQRLYQSPPACRKGPSWGRSFLCSTSWLQSAHVRRRPTNQRIDGSERCCWSYGSYVALHRVRRVVDELKSIPAQSIENRVDMARHESPIAALWRIQHDSLWC